MFGVYGAEGEVVELFDGRLMFNYRVDGPMVDHCPDGNRICDTGWGGNITMACGNSSTGRPAPHHCRAAMFSVSAVTRAFLVLSRLGFSFQSDNHAL